jgi:hypothetical protein
VLGDDLFARCSPQALSRLWVRVANLLGTKDRGAVGAAARLGSAWLGDAVGSTWGNFRQRSAAAAKAPAPTRAGKKRSEAPAGAAENAAEACGEDGSDEAAALLCPGVVYLLKPRANGALGVTTTKKGGLAESLLMQMHDVLLSQSMLAHHCLEAYIQAFDLI